MGCALKKIPPTDGPNKRGVNRPLTPRKTDAINQSMDMVRRTWETFTSPGEVFQKPPLNGKKTYHKAHETKWLKKHAVFYRKTELPKIIGPKSNSK